MASTPLLRLPPVAVGALTALKLPPVSKSHNLAPSLAEKARIWPAIEPEKTTPGITAMAPGCVAEQLTAPLAIASCEGVSPQAQTGGGAGTCQTVLPLAKSSAVRPPTVTPGCGRTSAVPTYIWVLSVAMPQTPAVRLPLPSLERQTSFPSWSGS